MAAAVVWCPAADALQSDQPAEATPSEAERPGGARPGRPAGQNQPPGEQRPEGEAAEGGKPQPGEGKEKGDEGDANAPVTRRGSEPPQPPDPKELEVRPDAEGLVQFNFRNQPWPELLDWLAEISGQPMDWQELPADFVNLASPRPYTIPEARDLFNRHLLARGFTLLELDGGLTVVKTENLNPALLQSVSREELDAVPAYRFVRTVFPLRWLKAEQLAEELKPMISASGKLVALKATNRLEAFDAAVNLRRIGQLIDEEESADARAELAREFELRHVPATEAERLLKQFLGVEKESAAPVLDPRQMQQMIQQQQQMAARNQGKPGADAGGKEPEISIVANPQRNSLIVSAPADRMAVAEEFIRRLDVPGSGIQSLADVQTRVQVFRLASLDPEKLVAMLREMNVLEPMTRLQVDEENNALMAFGSAADRFVINSLIERLDGSGRRFEVLQLRRLDAVEVAESIAFLMGTDEDQEDQSRRPSYYYYGGFGSRNDDKKKNDDKFRVSANARYRQILLWANELEMQEVRNLLVKLGELPPEGGRESRFRMIEASPNEETYQYLQRLQRHWESISPNPLVLPPEERFHTRESDAEPAVQDEEEAAQPDAEENQALPTVRDQTAARSAAPSPSRFASDVTPANFVSQRAQADGGDRAGEAGAARGSAEEDGAEAKLENRSGARGLGTAADAPGEAADPEYPHVDSADQFDRLFAPRAAAPQAAGGAAGSAEVRVEIDENGNLILFSDDPRALDRFEDLMLQIEPPKRPYHVFKVRYASATWVRLNLEDYFEEEEEEDNGGRDSFYSWYFGRNEDTKDSPRGLSGARKLRFISDIDTNTIIVTGADPRELKTIEELIELWDVPEPVNKSNRRFTRLIEVNYSRAEAIAQTVKDAYRDLLSSNDKEFQAGRQGQPGRGNAGDGVARQSGPGGSELVDSENQRDSGGAGFDFKGKLSIGVDEIGNTLLVSAEGESLLELVTAMIHKLDEAARPQGSVQIRDLPGGMNGTAMEAAVRAMLGQASPSDREGREGNRRGAGGREAGGRDGNGRGAGGRAASGGGQAGAAGGQPTAGAVE